MKNFKSKNFEISKIIKKKKKELKNLLILQLEVGSKSIGLIDFQNS